MENSTLLHTVLRSLGYTVHPTGARVNESVQPQSAAPDWRGPRYDGWNHMVNLVTMEGRTFLVDVGFGSLGPTGPMELVGGRGREVVNVPPAQRSRLRWGRIGDTVAGAGQELWVYEVCLGQRGDGDGDGAEEEEEWKEAYCFSTTEFLPRDFEVMSFFTSQSPTSWFTHMVVCSRMILGWEGEEGEKVIVGDVTLFNDEIKKRVAGKSEPLAVITTEKERVAALKEFLGIGLSTAEQEGIRGMQSEIKG